MYARHYDNRFLFKKIARPLFRNARDLVRGKGSRIRTLSTAAVSTRTVETTCTDRHIRTCTQSNRVQASVHCICCCHMIQARFHIGWVDKGGETKGKRKPLRASPWRKARARTLSLRARLLYGHVTTAQPVSVIDRYAKLSLSH